MAVLVIGASGDLGQRVVRALEARGETVNQFTRADGFDLADKASLQRAMPGNRAVFLQSSPTRDQPALEGNAIAAAVRAGVEHIVKLSNIPIAGLTSGLHGNHRTIEKRLAGQPVQHTFVQPSFFTTVLDRQRDLIATGKVVLPFAAGRVAWVDPDDIADVAAAAITEGITGPLVVTGPEAIDGDEVARRLGVTRLDPPLDEWKTHVQLDPWLLESTIDLYEAVQRGALDFVSPDVERVLGRLARPAFS